MASSDPALDAQQHVACYRQHDEGDDEEDQAQRDQRGGIEVTDRFGEFVGDGGRNGGARRQQRGRHLVRVADHEGHRHGLAERPAEPQHHAADDSDARVGQHDDAIGRAGKQRRQHGDIAESRDQERLQGLLQEGREYEQAPDAINDAWNARQELDGDPDGPSQPHGAQLSEKYGDQEPDRHRDQHRDERGDKRAVDRRQRAEFLRNRVPALLDEEIQTKGTQRRQRPIDEGNNDATEDDQHPDRCGAGENAEEHIGDTQPVERLVPRRYRVGLDRVALQRNIDHGSPPGGLCPGSPRRREERRSKATSWPPHNPYWTQTREGRQNGALPNLYPTSVGHGVERLA